MNIDTIINSAICKELSNDPPLSCLYNELGSTDIDSIKYRVTKITKLIDSDYTEENGFVYFNLNKNLADVVTNIKCNYKIAIELNNTINIGLLPSTPAIIKKILSKFPLFNRIFSEPIVIYENTIPITLPVLFMINTDIRFKIQLDNHVEPIKITYDCYTFQNLFLKKLNTLYREHKSIGNSRGMVIEDGILRHDFDLD